MCHNVCPIIFPTAGITMFDSCFLGILDYHLDQVAKTWGCLSDGMLWYAMGWIIRNKLVHGTGKINKSSTQYPLVNSHFAIKHGPIEIVDLHMKNGWISDSYVNVYQRVKPPNHKFNRPWLRVEAWLLGRPCEYWNPWWLGDPPF